MPGTTRKKAEARGGRGKSTAQQGNNASAGPDGVVETAGHGRRKRRASGGRHRVDPHPVAAAVGERIRQLRLEAGISFDAFVEETGLGRGYVSELERGLVVPSVHVLDKVANALGISMAQLVQSSPDP